MSFISYAQNFEDVILWRALKHIEQGFYIDVGAQDPEVDSVTKAFYDRGWRGINIEPIPQWFERLQKERPRDINLQLAAGREPGEVIFFEIPDTGLSTAEKNIAERHKTEHGYPSREVKVAVETLTNLCERYHLAPIHFLKIDVEGMEKAVLEGLDLEKIRPWIILVESTLPNTQEECHADWEPILLKAGYQYSYFDGLNRFYVAKEHSELLDAFKAPPNFFDDFQLNRQHQAEIRARAAESAAKEAEARAARAEAEAQEARACVTLAEAKAREAEVQKAQAEAKAQEAQARAARAEATLQAVYQSHSWRVTRPLRAMYEWWLCGRNRSTKAAKRLIAPPLEHLIRFAASRPWIKRLALPCIRRYPAFEAHLLRFAAQQGLAGHQPAESLTFGVPPELYHDIAHLSPRAREIYFQLKTAVEQKRREST